MPSFAPKNNEAQELPNNKKLLFVTDIHGTTAHIKLLAESVGHIDLLLIGGDFTNFGGVEQVRPIIKSFQKYFPRLLCVHGNLDHSSVEEWLAENELSLHGKTRILDDMKGKIALFGLGGSNKTPMKTLTEYEEEEIAQILAKGYPNPDPSVSVILVSHMPPKNSLTDKIFSGKHVGSLALRNFLEERKIDLCLCGHIHESSAIDTIFPVGQLATLNPEGASKKTIVCNPGPFSSGCYAVIEVGPDKLECRKAKLSLGAIRSTRNSIRICTSKAIGFLRHKLLLNK